MNKTKNMKVVSKEYINSNDQLSRWLALIEGIELIEQKATDLKMNKNDIDNLMKPLALQKYINERYNSIKLELDYQDEN